MKISTVTLLFSCIICNGLASIPFQDLKNRSEVIDQVSQDKEHRHHLRRNFHHNGIERINDYNNKSFSRIDSEEMSLRKLKKAGVFRTYGKGKAQVSTGEIVNVPNSVEQGRFYSESYTTTTINTEVNKPINGQSSQLCITECPTDHTVIAEKGNNFVILPHPCPGHRWHHISGPQPGNKINEGLHSITGILETTRQYCQYQYQVLVHRCPPLKPPGIESTIKCSENNIWGSTCSISCGQEYDTIGASDLECLGNLTWSQPLPKCKRATDCMKPKIRSNSKMSCQSADLTSVEGQFIPNGTNCRFNRNRRLISITCRNGTWRAMRRIKGPERIQVKNKVPQSLCTPDFCKNGGTCLEPDIKKGSPICICRPYTRGMHCEMKQCIDNICQNQGLCYHQNEEKVCYCFPQFYGSQCQFQRQH